MGLLLLESCGVPSRMLPITASAAPAIPAFAVRHVVNGTVTVSAQARLSAPGRFEEVSPTTFGRSVRFLLHLGDAFMGIEPGSSPYHRRTS